MLLHPIAVFIKTDLIKRTVLIPFYAQWMALKWDQLELHSEPKWTISQ